MVTPPPALSRTERYEIPNEVPFPLRLHIMLQHTEVSGQGHIVSWMPSGKSFRVNDRDAFSQEILPEYFRSSNFRSFQRNLSVYQFARIWSGPDKGAYCHPNFVRHDRKLCTLIKRHVPQKKEPPDNQENSVAGTTTKASLDGAGVACKSEELQRYIQMNNKELPDLNQEEGIAAASSEQSGTLSSLLGDSMTQFHRQHFAALAPLMNSRQGFSSTLQPSYSTVAGCSMSSTTVGVGTFLFGSPQQSAASQLSSMLPRGSLSLDSTTSGFLAGYHNELHQAMMSAEGLAKGHSAPPHNLLLLQQQLFPSNSFSSHNNADPGGDVHGKGLEVSSSTRHELPSSPGPQCFEDDDPFLLDRLWSQTLRMTMNSNDSLVSVPHSVGYEQPPAVIWGSRADEPPPNSVPHSCAHQEQQSSSNTGNTNFAVRGVRTSGSYGNTVRFIGEEEQATRKDMIINDHDSRGGLSIPTNTMTTAAGGFQQEGAYFYDDNTRKGGMSLFRPTTGSNSRSSTSSGSILQGDPRRYRHQELLQEEDLNSIPAPSDGSGGGDRGKGGIMAFSSCSSEEPGEEEWSSKNNNPSRGRNHHQTERNVGKEEQGTMGPFFRDIW